MSHTPGPWKLNNACIQEPGGSCVVCFGHDYDDYGGITAPYSDGLDVLDQHEEEKASNVRLVVAAPDLLDALRGIVDIGKRDMSNPKYDGYFESARAAIAKAEGEEVKKSLTVAEAGRLGGTVGGRSTSAAKVAAARKNIARARAVKLGIPVELRSPSDPKQHTKRRYILPDGREVSRQYISQLKNRKRGYARRVVATELKIGRLKRQPCRECGKEPAEAHHPDYDKPREVIWLCPKHHGEAHRKV